MMRKLPLLFIALVAPLLMAAPAAAQAEKGDNEILLFGIVSMDPKDASNSAQGNFFFNVGRFVTDKVQVGGGPSISISKSSADPFTGEEGGVDATFGFNAFVRNYFGATKVQPYIGGEFFMFDVETSSTAFAQGIGGVKSYISERAAIDFKGAYGVALQKGDFEAERRQSFQFSIGLSVLF